jgi:pseudouridine-5'-phosphate glycosidase
MSRWLINRAHRPGVALETTIVLHGVPRDRARELWLGTMQAVRNARAVPCLTGVLHGRAVAGLSDHELDQLQAAQHVPKVNSANLGVALTRGQHGATTAGATIELAAAVGLAVAATGGIGGVHHPGRSRLDISADLAALARHPVAIVTSGCKNILDIGSTRELLETLGVPCVGFRCDSFPAFYQRQTDLALDARFDTIDELAAYVAFETSRTGRGVVVCQPVPEQDEIPGALWAAWLEQASSEPTPHMGRAATPAMLERLHAISAGRTIKTNISLAINNAGLAGSLAAHLDRARQGEVLGPSPGTA